MRPLYCAVRTQSGAPFTCRMVQKSKLPIPRSPAASSAVGPVTPQYRCTLRLNDSRNDYMPRQMSRSSSRLMSRTASTSAAWLAAPSDAPSPVNDKSAPMRMTEYALPLTARRRACASGPTKTARARRSGSWRALSHRAMRDHCTVSRMIVRFDDDEQVHATSLPHRP